LPVDRERGRVLDVGCGSGTSLLGFLKLGFSARNLAGIDINSDRLQAARFQLPSINFRCESADRMTFDASIFDIVFESTMFVSLTDEVLAKRIASEMIRVAKPNHYIVLTDWRYSRPGNSNYLGLSQKRIGRLFDVGTATERLHLTNGALIPPIGRAISHYGSAFYFLMQAAFPFAVGQTTTVLRKTAS
jgi:ubiquinone/menaquinone biosynthesis C-methylase UbiE